MSSGGTADPCAQSIDLLAERIAAIPVVLSAALDSDVAPLTHIGVDEWLVTGAGGSEGPARSLVTAVTKAALQPARFVPLSSFVASGPERAPHAGLVVFSQGLSPNAKLALAARHHFDHTVLVTATASDDPFVTQLRQSGVRLLHHGPDEESGMLVRVVGPAVATSVALRLGGIVIPAGLAELVAEASRRAPAAPLEGRVALITAGGVSAQGLRWKLLEALGLPDPPVWDVLQVAHGPFQQFYERPMTLITLEEPNGVHRNLFDRLQQMLVTDRHSLVRLRAHAGGSLTWFEHDALVNGMVLHNLRRTPRDLINWPGKGRDGALYGITPATGSAPSDEP